MCSPEFNKLTNQASPGLLYPEFSWHSVVQFHEKQHAIVWKHSLLLLLEVPWKQSVYMFVMHSIKWIADYTYIKLLTLLSHTICIHNLLPFLTAIESLSTNRSSSTSKKDSLCKFFPVSQIAPYIEVYLRLITASVYYKCLSSYTLVHIQ